MREFIYEVRIKVDSHLPANHIHTDLRMKILEQLDMCLDEVQVKYLRERTPTKER